MMITIPTTKTKVSINNRYLEKTVEIPDVRVWLVDDVIPYPI